jgi:hypothetical protein
MPTRSAVSPFSETQTFHTARPTPQLQERSMTIQSHGHEHELEPQYGLPERLPAGEHILWQGSPDFRTVALRIFHLRKVALYWCCVPLLPWPMAAPGLMACWR